MNSEEFQLRIHEIFACSRGKKFMNGMGEGTKGAIPTIIELHKAEFQGVELTAGDLSERFNVSTARIAVLLNTLEDKGFIQRYKSDKDGRKTFIRLTDQGREKAEGFKTYWDNILNKILADLPDEDLEAFFRVLSKMAMNMEGEKGSV